MPTPAIMMRLPAHGEALAPLVLGPAPSDWTRRAMSPGGPRRDHGQGPTAAQGSLTIPDDPTVFSSGFVHVCEVAGLSSAPFSKALGVPRLGVGGTRNLRAGKTLASSLPPLVPQRAILASGPRRSHQTAPRSRATLRALRLDDLVFEIAPAHQFAKR